MTLGKKSDKGHQEGEWYPDSMRGWFEYGVRERRAGPRWGCQKAHARQPKGGDLIKGLETEGGVSMVVARPAQRDTRLQRIGEEKWSAHPPGGGRRQRQRVQPNGRGSNLQRSPSRLKTRERIAQWRGGWPARQCGCAKLCKAKQSESGREGRRIVAGKPSLCARGLANSPIRAIQGQDRQSAQKQTKFMPQRRSDPWARRASSVIIRAVAECERNSALGRQRDGTGASQR